MDVSACIVIPCYNHGSKLAGVLARTAPLGLTTIVVEDGSSAPERDKARIAAQAARCIYIERVQNGGKGAAFLDGLKRAHALGFSHVLQIDADGQHEIEKTPELLAIAQQDPASLVSGTPVYDSSIPKSRLYGRKITDFWVAIETAGRQIQDAMCGFRVYPVAKTLETLQGHRIGLRMDFDIEILVRLFWQGVPVHFVPIRVVYPADGVSTFDPVRDNLRISLMHTRLVLEAPLHWGKCLSGHWAGIAERRGTWGIRLLLAVNRLFGRGAFTLFLAPVIGAMLAGGGVQRRALRRFLDRAEGRADELSRAFRRPSLFAVYMNFAQVALDKILAWTSGFSVPVAHEAGAQELLAPQPGSRGRVLLVSHVGGIEVCRALVHGSVRVYALVYEKHAADWKAAMASYAPDSQIELLAVDRIDASTAVMLREKIDAGDWVAIAADRVPVDGGPRRCAWAPFLGVPAPFPVGGYVLASLMQAPVEAVFAFRTGEGYKVRAVHFSDRIVLPRAGREVALGECAARYAQILEGAALDYPDNWFNFFDFWDQVPEASSHGRQSNG